MAKKFPSPEGEFSFSVPVQEEYGRFPMTIAKKTFPVVLAKVKKSDIKLDPGNPRLGDDEDLKPNTSGLGQKRIVKALTTDKMQKSAASLQASMEYHGGQNEAIWVHASGDPKEPIVIEGNRRRAIAEKLAGWDSFVCYIFPDEMSKDFVFQLMARRHLAEIERWSSAVRSEVAYKFLTGEIGGVEGNTPEERLKNVVALMQFTSEKMANKFIHSHIWWKHSGLAPEEWSKFHHAYVPRLKDYFGYDEGHIFDPTRPEFRSELRQTPKKSGLTIAELDELIQETAEKAAAKAGKKPDKFQPGFNWFVQLIENDKVTDCRHSDGIVAPALVAANKSYGPQVLELLQQPATRKSKSLDGSRLDPNTPAQMAWNYLREARQENHLYLQVERLKTSLFDGTKPIRLKGYRKPTTDNRMLRNALKTLSSAIDAFLQKTKQADEGDLEEVA